MRLSRNNNYIGDIQTAFAYADGGVNDHRSWLNFGQGGLAEQVIAWDEYAPTYSYINMSTTTSVSDMLNQAPGLSLWGIPRTGAMAEGFSGTTASPTTAAMLGKFYTPDFSRTIVPLSGLHPDVDNKPWFGLTFYLSTTTTSYRGTLIIAINDTTRNTLNSIFNPDDMKTVGAVAINGPSSILGLGTTQQWNFSNNQQPSSGVGYNSTSRFSVDDGVWGINSGTTNNTTDGNSPGPRLGYSGSTPFGFANYNAGDSSANYFYWSTSNTTTSITSTSVRAYLFSAFN
tara:strand:+ start:3151 stop:4008 length:858 start_codon:yes stop_codon:yes gene_type:complete